MGTSFGRNRRRTHEKTQTSKEKATQEDHEKERSPVTRIDWHRRKNPKAKIHQAFIQILSKMWLNRHLLGIGTASTLVTLAVQELRLPRRTYSRRR
ncbi:MAG TPA: hypothetical protein VI864_06275 [Candidatus Bathyarchaeia archaeon]|nr:hypothetical protein [Candidatus Bathyarchaeia archaeon]